MSLELNLRFPEPQQLIVRCEDEETCTLAFENPLNDSDKDDIRWYLEVYGTQYTSAPDDARAVVIAGKLQGWGEALFKAAFEQNVKAHNLIAYFLDEDEPGRLLTVSAGHPKILSLPWELLCPPGGVFLFDDNPRISVRRRITGLSQWRRPVNPKIKNRLHLLFVVSRPKDAGFIDPRTESQAVLDALDRHAPGRVETEFLRPATLQGLQERLRDDARPAVDILHFDGHGIYDSDGRLRDTAKQAHIPDYAQALVREAEREASDAPDNQGYLLFEEADGSSALIPAKILGELLYKQKVGLAVLSACQSAAVGGQSEEDAMGSVSARLAHAGIPNVLAMTHTVLVATTRKLFGKFYAALLGGKPVGAALDDARAELYFDPKRGERRRGESGAEKFTLKLYDWFLPALYQCGKDAALLGPGAAGKPRAIEKAHNLPKLQEAGFWGRTHELWQIERAFVQGTRRLSVTGFGGQGKTYLAVEAGRWLLRTGMFRRVCFISFAGFQGVDPTGMAVSTLAAVLNENLLDAKAAAVALAETPVLIILDNLETLENPAASPGRQRSTGDKSLLDAAKIWSEAGQSRVLLTSRRPDFDHPDYKTEGSREHIALSLQGLGEEDALHYFQVLSALPPEPQVKLPERGPLLKLFTKVAFHPLSIALLARQLKIRRIADLGERLEFFLAAAEPGDRENRSLMASLNLSLERLDEEALRWLPRLGVFLNGAMQDVLLRVTELGQADDDPETAKNRQLLEAMESGDVLTIVRALEISLPEGVESQPEMLEKIQRELLPQLLEQKEKLAEEVNKHKPAERAAGVAETVWPELKKALIHTGLMETENFPGVNAPYLRFHPTLAPALWARLDATQRKELQTRHCQEYYRLSGYLYYEDDRRPEQTRAIVLRELPNLLRAVYTALDAGDENAAEFANNVNRFLDCFGLRRDHEALAARSAETAGASGSKQWYLARSNQGEQLFSAGRTGEAQQVFEEVLAGLGEQPSYERCVTLLRLGRCLNMQGHLDEAEVSYREALAVAGLLEQSSGVKRQTGGLQTDLADVLTNRGDYAGAREAYEVALEIATEQDDRRQMGIVNLQFGTLVLQQNDLAEAARRYREALGIFQALKEPATEAVVWHQLGRTHQEAQQWEAAEQAYRESARLEEEQGNLQGAAQTWNQLANVTRFAGKPHEAEAWYRKAIEGGKTAGDKASVSKRLSNLAILLLNHFPDRLAEARLLAEESLAIKQTLDPAAAEIWTTYNILAQLADRQEDTAQAAGYHRQAREAKMNFQGTRHEMRQYAELIAGVAATVKEPEQRPDLEEGLTQMAEQGWGDLATAIRRILDGERDEEVLCEPLDGEDAAIITTILQGIQDPESLKELMEEPKIPAEGDPLGGLNSGEKELAGAVALWVLRPELREQFGDLPGKLRQAGRFPLAAALEKLQAGEAEAAQGLDAEDSRIITAALYLQKHPDSLQNLLGSHTE
ncbi:MAG: tetratricopeptide repeat protein [Gammaproteobacteria bacterium]|nr:tetratricopeptide repeat protein [Gammaproteobacteria bacterium]